MTNNPRFEVEVTTVKTGETKLFSSYDEFISLFRFFLSSGKRYEDFESKCEGIMQQLGIMDDHGMAMEFHHSGLIVKIIYLKFPDYDRFMHYIKKAG